MNRDVAKIVALTAFQSSAKLNNLVPLLKEFCEADEYSIYVRAIAKASAEISLEVLQRIFISHPELKSEFEEKVAKYGRPF